MYGALWFAQFLVREVGSTVSLLPLTLCVVTALSFGVAAKLWYRCLARPVNVDVRDAVHPCTRTDLCQADGLALHWKTIPIQL